MCGLDDNCSAWYFLPMCRGHAGASRRNLALVLLWRGWLAPLPPRTAENCTRYPPTFHPKQSMSPHSGCLLQEAALCSVFRMRPRLRTPVQHMACLQQEWGASLP
jgi:hypothetical protein